MDIDLCVDAMAAPLTSSSPANRNADNDDETSTIQNGMNGACDNAGGISGNIGNGGSDAPDHHSSPPGDVVDGDGVPLMVASEATMDSADIIPEAAMKCGIIPLGSLLGSDDEDAYREICERNDFHFDG